MNGIKLFDAKFIAINLQNLMRCPKCGSEYQDRFEIVGPGLPFNSHRPFLLGCGHSICENCILAERHQLICAVCNKPAPPTKNTLGATKEQRYRVRDLYDLNFHVVGELQSNGYIRRFGCVNNFLNSSAKNKQLEMDVKIKCSECEDVIADVQCHQCDAYYCKRCFDTVHLHSKVLKTHHYDKLTKKNIDNIIKIDNVCFDFPKKQYCPQHQMVRNLHCKKCRSIICSACVLQYHQRHKVCSFQELNKNYVSDISALQKAVSTTYHQIKKNEQVIRNMDNVLEGYAIQTLEKISNCFIYMHGLLQNAELRITESIREKCLNPQNKLLHAMNKLNGYEDVLNKMRESLAIYSKDVPSDIDMKSLVSLYYKHLKNIPNHMSLTEINANPFVFETDENLIKKFDNICHSKFKSPKFDIKYYFPSESLGVIDQRLTSPGFLNLENVNSSELNNAFSRNSSEQNFHLNQQKVMNWNKQNNKIIMNSSKQESSQDNNAKKNMNLTTSLQSFITCDEAQLTQTTDEPKSKIKKDMLKLPLYEIPKKVGWLKNNTMVRISSIETPNSFYLQTFDNFMRIRDSLIKASKPKIQISIKIGNMYLFFRKTHKIWYRALVKDFKNNNYTVFLVDVGVNINVKVENNQNESMFYEISVKDTEIPYAAIHCSLLNILPAVGTKWTEEAKLLMLQIADKYTLYVKYIREVRNNFYIVDLCATKSYNKFYVRDAFLYSGVAQERSCDFPLRNNPKAKFKYTVSKLNQISKTILQPGEMISAQMIHIETPGEFYVIEHTKLKNRDAFLHKLNEFFNGISDSNLEPIFVGVAGMGCIVNIKNTWHRASILEICGSGYVRVRLVDHGREDTISWRDVFNLPENLKHQQFALRCSLVDVEPMQIDGYTWTTETNAEFKQLTSNPNMQIETISVENDRYNVVLRILKNNKYINIGAMLVHRRLASSTGIHATTVIDHPIQQALSNCIHGINMKPFTSRQSICHNAAKSEDTNSAEVKKIIRVPVCVIHVVDPSEFYLRLTSMNAGLSIFEDSIQDVCKKKVDSFLNKAVKSQINWKKNDHCLVHTKIKKKSNSKWYRGIITAVAFPVKLTKQVGLFSVFLRDYGITVECIHSGRILPIDNELDQTANAAQRCNLAGLTAPGLLWSTSATEYFTTLLTESQSLTATFVEGNNYTISVILWGVSQDDSDPLAPSTKINTNINQCIGRAGYAIYKHCETIKEDKLLNKNVLNYDFQSTQALVKKIDLEIEKVDNKDISNGDIEEDSTNYENDEYLNELIDDNIVVTIELPVAWLVPRSITKTIFTAKPSYVDYDANIYITLVGDLNFLTKMKAQMAVMYTNVFNSNIHLNDFYRINQPCVVIYHRDNCYYRGIVKKVNSDDSYEVFFVDYGNVETVSTAEIIPYAPLPDLHSMTTRIRISGIKPVNNERFFPTDVLDKIHSKLVDKLVSVTVLTDDILQRNKIPKCVIRVGSLDIANFLIEEDFAVQIESTFLKDQCIDLHEKENDSFYTNADGPTSNLLDENLNNSHLFQKTLVCSPKTKKPLYDWEDLKSFHENLTINEDLEDGFDNINEQNFGTIDNDLEIDEINIIKEQLQQRLSYQLEDKGDLNKFCSLDTSMVLSAFNGIESIPPQKLPNGVIEFKCSIDGIITPTELQIYPRLIELQKRDLEMMRVTAQLIKNMPHLSNYEPNMLCLACYGRDRKWYRAMIRSYNMSQRKAIVLYIDYLNEETLPLRKLRQMPKELLDWPLRSLRVKLHNITPNPCIREHEVRKALGKCIQKFPVLHARVFKNVFHNNTINSSDESNSVNQECNRNCNVTRLCSPAYMQDGPRISFVELYEDSKSLVPIYQYLIDNEIYITNKT